MGVVPSGVGAEVRKQVSVPLMLDDDRRRIASEIHDGPVQDLTVARLRIDLLRQRLQGDAALEDLDGVEQTIALASDRLDPYSLFRALEPYPSVHKAIMQFHAGGRFDSDVRIRRDAGHTPTERPEDKDLQDHTFGMNAAKKLEEAEGGRKKGTTPSDDEPGLADGVSPEIERLVGVAQAVLSQESTAR